MKQIIETYQYHFLSDNTDIEVTNENVSKIMSKFHRFGLIPSHGEEINPISKQFRKVLFLNNLEGTLRLEFGTNDIMIAGKNTSLTDFHSKVFDILDILKDLYPNKKASRLSVVSSSAYQASDAEFENLYKDLFTYKGASDLVEWDNRIVQRFSLEKSQEIVNSISSIRRGEMQLQGGVPFDVIGIDLDSNTIHQNTDKRFDYQAAKDVYSELKEDNERMRGLLERYVPTH